MVRVIAIILIASCAVFAQPMMSLEKLSAQKLSLQKLSLQKPSLQKDGMIYLLLRSPHTTPDEADRAFYQAYRVTPKLLRSMGQGYTR